MLEIYFDGKLLDSDKYLSLTQKGTMFDNEFKLGTVLSREFNLTIPKSDFNPNCENVLIKYMSNDYAHLIIDNYTYNESSGMATVDIVLMDKMVLANTKYDASPIVPTTTLGILQDICNKIGVELGNTDFTNNDVVVDFYNSEVNARTYISYIAECSGGFARIENDGKLYIRTFSNETSSEAIVPELCEQILIGEKQVVERVVYDNGLIVLSSNEDATLKTLYLNSENVYINSDVEFNKLCDNIIGFEYYNLDTGKTYISPNISIGDVLKLTYDNTMYYTIAQFETLSFYGNWQGSYKLNVQNSNQLETKVNGYSTQIKELKVLQDRTNNTLSIVISDVSSQKEANDTLLDKIQANTTLINQTANSITSSVTEINGTIDTTKQDLLDELGKLKSELDEKISKNESNIEQLSTSITSTVKTTGGTNLLKNSVGFADLDFWEVTGSVISSQDNYTEQNTTSGSKWLFNAVGKLKQSFVTQVGTTYGVSFKMRHIINGTANSIAIRIHNSDTDYIEVLNTSDSYSTFTEFNTFTFEATNTSPYIEIENFGDDIFEISDLIISTGDNQYWSVYADEVYGKQHRLDKYGLILTDIASGDTTSLTNTTLQIINNSEVVAELSKTQVLSDSGNFANKIQLRNLQMVSFDDDNVVEYV